MTGNAVTINGFQNGSEPICILHFNDVYNIEPHPDEPKGGAARFANALHSFDHLKPLILFSGDIISPSIMSTFTRGQQMVPVLEKCKVDCAMYGNHEFDFGLEHLIDFTKQTKFPWLLSNAFDKETSKPLCDGKPTHIIEHCGVKIGLIGLIEEDWLSTLVVDRNLIDYVDFVIEGRRLSRMLKETCNVDIVIALTHMRMHNDIKLAENVTEIDLILGGHDHDYELREVNGKFVIKSGSDFRQFSKIQFNVRAKKIVDLNVEEILVTSKFAEDQQLVVELEKFKNEIEHKMDNEIAYLECDLDGRFSSTRSKETNLGNLIADTILDAVEDADIALVNSGTLRSDRVHSKGVFKFRDLVTILPFMDTIVVLQATGQQVHQVLENGVSMYPKLEGRFPQVSGVTFAFDPSKPPGSRINVDSIKISGASLISDKQYKVAVKKFIADGKDGYDVLKECPVYKDEEENLTMIQGVHEYFEALKLIQLEHMTMPPCNGEEKRRKKSLISMSRRHSKHNTLDTECVAKDIHCRLNPKVEGRIVNLKSVNL